MVKSLAKSSRLCRLQMSRKEFASASEAVQALKEWARQGAQGWAQWTSAVRKVKSEADLSSSHTPDFNDAERMILKGVLLEAELAHQTQSVRVFYQNQVWVWIESRCEDVHTLDSAQYRCVEQSYLSTLNQTPYETRDLQNDPDELAKYETFWDLSPSGLQDLNHTSCVQVGPVFSRFVGWIPKKQG